ncbi:MAG: hypothetical protein M3R41_07305 [Pseudomonadota bacterium]|nr:hypothetical protein [Pseudomonadota bacterium]
MILPLLLAAASHHACTRPPLTPVLRRTLSPVVQDAAHRPVRPGDIGKVIDGGRWRLAWATPAKADRGVFFLHRDGASGWRFVDVWGGSITPDERRDTAAWARKRGRDFPPALAKCFVDALLTG